MQVHEIAKQSVYWAFILLGFLYQFTTLEKLVVARWGLKPPRPLLQFIRILDQK